VAVEFGSALAQGGMQGFLSHFLSKLAPNVQEEVAGNILREFKRDYPNLISDPQALDAWASDSDNLAKLTSQMSKALRGHVGQIADDIGQAIQQGLPRGLSVGEQNTFRGEMRRFVRLGNDML